LVFGGRVGKKKREGELGKDRKGGGQDPDVRTQKARGNDVNMDRRGEKQKKGEKGQKEKGAKHPTQK